ncbi:MAG: DUF3800 domain-containing protein [Pyrinomonadaceae bacterium]
MLMLNAYFDETGHGDDPTTRILGIAGCLTGTEAWKKVEHRWSEALKSEGLPYFHMREYAFSTGPFKSWKNDEARRRKIYSALWEIILGAKLNPLGGFVQLAGYKQELQGQDYHIFRDAYFLCYLQCLRFLAQYTDFDSVKNVVTFFDNKEGFKGEALKIHGALNHRFKGKIPPPTFRDMRVVLPLQIADIIAYESKKEFERQVFGLGGKPRWGVSQVEKLISLSAPHLPALLGNQDCPIALLSREELARVSRAQELAFNG